MNQCLYCQKSEKLNSLMIEIMELPFSIVYLNRNQQHQGRCIVALKEHKEEYFQMTPEQNAAFFAEVALVAKAVFNIFKPNKINYATFGDTVPHVHVHIVPKHEGKFQWAQFFNDSDTIPKKFLTDDEYKSIIQKIKTEIETLKK
jgi:diadenosine tetraphosphate (Ap4A) HIT family hydrolase